MIGAFTITLLLQITVEQPIEGGDVAAARKLALDRAIQELVVEAAARQNLSLPVEILQAARQFVSQYRILDEQEDGALLRLSLEGDVTTGKLVRATGDRATPLPVSEAPPPRLFDEGVLRGVRLFAARARVDEFDAWGFGSSAEAARDAASEAALRQQAARNLKRELSLVASGIDSPLTLRQMQEALMQRVAGVTAVSLRRAGRGRFEFALVATRAPASIAAALAALPFENFRIELREIGPPIRVAVHGYH